MGEKESALDLEESKWKSLKHFTANENWGDPQRMNRGFLQSLDSFREHINTQIFIICGTQGKHCEHSSHNQGIAVDIVIPKLKCIDAFWKIMRWPFTGVGIYPFWEYQGIKLGGFHVEQGDVSKVMRLWMGLGTNNDNTEYIDVTLQSLNKFFTV